MQDYGNERRRIERKPRERADGRRRPSSQRYGREEKAKKADKFINTLLFQSGICLVLLLSAIAIKNSPGEMATKAKQAISGVISRTSGEEEVGAFFSEAQEVYNDWKEKAVAVFSKKKNNNEEENQANHSMNQESEEQESSFVFDEQTTEGTLKESTENTNVFLPEKLTLSKTNLFAGNPKEPALITSYFELSDNEEEYQDFETGEVRVEFTREVDMRILNLGIDFQKPVEGVMTSGFGERIHPITENLSFHYGIDIAAAKGTPIRAAQSGKIKEIGKSIVYGNYVIIEHPNDTETFYGHCQKVTVKEGKKIKTGDKIALVGSTGVSTGSHLHFEIRHDQKVLNPEGYLTYPKG